MRALRYHDYATAPTIERMPEPIAGPGEVLVRVERAALNPLDLKLLSGGWQRYFDIRLPYVMGSDFAGTVVARGEGEGVPAIGARIIGRRAPLEGGAFAEFVSIGREYIAPLPAKMDMAQGAGVPTAAGTAWEALFDAGRLERGQTVLVHAAAGGVGGYAVQIAKAAGAKVIATASGDGLRLAKNYGADEVIDYRAVAFERAAPRVDLVLDTVGFETQRRSFDVLRPGGALVSVVDAPDEVLAIARGVRAVRVYYRLEPGWLATLVDRVDDIGARVAIDGEHPFSDPLAAIERQRSGRAKGKIILDMTR